MKKLFWILLITCLSSILFAQEIPLKISYQGKLLESGIPVNGTKDITFSIGTWEETHGAVQILEGLYSVTLGENNPLPVSLFNNSSSLQLEIILDGTSLQENIEIVSAPFAFKSQNAVDAEKLDGQSPLYYINWDNMSNVPSDIADGDDVDDADNDPQNECQTLSVNGNNLSISPCGNSVTLPGGGLILPYSGVYNGNNEAFRIVNEGTGNVAEFEIGNEGSDGTVLFLENNGSGSTIDINQNGGGDAIFISSETTSGDAIQINNHANNGSAIYVKNYGNDRALYVRNYGNDRCAFISTENTNNSEPALYVTTDGSGLAGYFNGDVEINGDLIGGKGHLKIDHPLDPDNKYLYHSFVESPDMMNVYNGNISTNEKGFAVVELPEYFGTLNMDFRYQLTCFGVFSQAIVYEKINNNQFTIRTEKPNVEVSWQVTGIRKDPYAMENRIKVEVDKPENEKGYYLHYKEYNQPFEKSVQYKRQKDTGK